MFTPEKCNEYSGYIYIYHGIVVTACGKVNRKRMGGGLRGDICTAINSYVTEFYINITIAFPRHVYKTWV